MKRNEREYAMMKRLLVPYTEQILRKIEIYQRIPHKYSARFEAKKERILWRGGSSGLKTKIVICAMILIVLVCAACVAPSLAERCSAFLRADSYERVDFREYDAVREGDYPAGMPSYIPEGYRIVEERIAYTSAAKVKNNGEQKYVLYYNGRDFISLKRHSDVENMYFDLLSGHYELRTLTGEKQNYVVKSCTDAAAEAIIGWKTGDYCYMIRGNLSQSELLKMAESLTEDPCPFLVPSYIPEGFSEISCYYDEWSQYFTYRGAEERQILFARRDYETEWNEYPYDDLTECEDEYSSMETVVNGEGGTWICSADGRYNHIRWKEDGWWYDIGGEVSVDTLIAMAESIGTTHYRRAADYAGDRD